MSKGWIYYNSEKGSSNRYNTITWSFNKDYSNDKAQGWFHLYTYEGLPNKIVYYTFNKESYSLIQNSISSNGFKLENSEIEDDEIISTYNNSLFTLIVSTQKRNDDDWINKSFTGYKITLIKKSGIYDEYNGKKTEYYYGDVVKTEFNLLNGKIHGAVKQYHENGKLKLSGNYANGIKNGLFKEFDEDGNIEIEYNKLKDEINGIYKLYYPNGKLKILGNYLNGKKHGNFIEYDIYGNKTLEYFMTNGYKNGVMKVFENGKINFSITFKDDIKNGQYIQYFYDDFGKLSMKIVGEYLEDEVHDTWKSFTIKEDNSEKLLGFINYKNGVENGEFKKVNGDSLIIGNYKSGELHGEYKVYRDFNKNKIKTDLFTYTLITEGTYFEGIETGYWKIYDILKLVRMEGAFKNGEKNGEWKYRYADILDYKKNKMSCSNELFLIENYIDGKLDGKTTKYSLLVQEEISCSEIDSNRNPLDTCIILTNKKILEISFYKNGILHGPYELKDSSNQTIRKGLYKNNLKEGEWYERYSEEDENENIVYTFEKGNYIKDKREGKWIEYDSEERLLKTFNYKNNELYGEYIIWNEFQKPEVIKKFENGDLKEFIRYDSLGVNILNKYEIYDEKSNSFKCKHSKYFKKGNVTIEYRFNYNINKLNHNYFEFFFFIETDEEFSNDSLAFKDGDFIVTNSSNQPVVIAKFYKEDKIGVWTYFYYEQNVKIEYSYVDNEIVNEIYLTLNDDRFSGVFIFEDEENEIKEIRKIKNGLRNGNTVYIDKLKNKPFKKVKYKNGEIK